MPTYQSTAPSGAATGPTTGPEEPDPSGQKPHGYYRDTYFGTLAPAQKTVEWSGHTNECDLRILEADEQRWCSQYAFERAQGHTEAEAYLQARTIALIAKTLQSVDGKPIADECTTLEHRLQLAAELPDTLQEALIAAYDEARYEPIKLLSEMQQDGGAPFDGPATGPGSSPVAEASPSGG